MTEPISDEMTAKFLQAAILSLRKDVVPALSNPSARIHADLVTRVLYMLHSRFSHRGADIQALLAEEHALQKEIDALMPEAPEGSEPPPASDGAFSAIEKLERQLYQQEMDLVGKVPRLLDLARGDGKTKRAAVASLRKIVDTQIRFLAAQDPDILKGSYVCYQGGRIDEEHPVERPALLGAELTEENLTRHLQGRFPGASVEDLSITAGGFSKTTIFLTLVHASGEREQLVMRKDLPVEFTSPIGYEFPLLQKIHKAGFPVAEPVWLEDDPKPFGGGFMLSRRVNGSTDFSRWAGDRKAVDGFARQLAKVMVDLHSLPLDQLGYAAKVESKSAGDLMREEIERWYGILVRNRKEVYPIEEMVFAWLKANIPETAFSRPACLVHGDIGFHNLMIDDGRVTALLDWEFSHLGDPVEDLIYTKPFIEKVMDWETFKSCYREYGGAPCTEEEEFFYTVWSKSRSPASGVQAAALYAESVPHEIKFAVSGYILARYLGVEAGRMVVDALDAA